MVFSLIFVLVPIIQILHFFLYSIYVIEVKGVVKEDRLRRVWKKQVEKRSMKVGLSRKYVFC